MSADSGRVGDKVAIVTGAARGTGEAIARLFAEEGARVVIADVLVGPGQTVASELGDPARFVELDVTDEASWAACIEETVGAFGTIDILINNAGVLAMAAIEDHTVEDFERCHRVNTLGPFLGIQAVAPAMQDAGRGSIVNVTSIDSTKARTGIAGYAASKWAARGLTKVAALELGRFGIRVNAVCPEAGSTHMVADHIPEGVDPEWALSLSHRRLATQKDRTHSDRLRDVAQAVLHLASDESASTTGTDLIIDSGLTAGTISKGSPGT